MAGKRRTPTRKITVTKIGGVHTVDLTSVLAELYVRAAKLYQKVARPLTNDECRQLVLEAAPEYTNYRTPFGRLVQCGLVEEETDSQNKRNKLRLVKTDCVVRVDGKIVWPTAQAVSPVEAKTSGPASESEPSVKTSSTGTDAPESSDSEDLFDGLPKRSREFVDFLRKEFGEKSFTVGMVAMRTSETSNTVGNRVRRLVVKNVLEPHPTPDGQPDARWYGVVAAAHARQVSMPPNARKVSRSTRTPAKILSTDELYATIQVAYPGVEFTNVDIAGKTGMVAAMVNHRLRELIYAGRLERVAGRPASSDRRGRRASSPPHVYRLKSAPKLAPIDGTVDSAATLLVEVRAKIDLLKSELAAVEAEPNRPKSIDEEIRGLERKREECSRRIQEITDEISVLRDAHRAELDAWENRRRGLEDSLNVAEGTRDHLERYKALT